MRQQYKDKECLTIQEDASCYATPPVDLYTCGRLGHLATWIIDQPWRGIGHGVGDKIILSCSELDGWEVSADGVLSRVSGVWYSVLFELL